MRRFSTSPPANGCWAVPRSSAARFAAASAPPRCSPPRSESRRTSCWRRSPRTSPSPTACAASDRTICTAYWMTCRLTDWSGSARNRCRRSTRPESSRSAICSEPATRRCGARSAHGADPCRPWPRESTTDRSLRIGTPSRSAPSRRSHPTSAARHSSRRQLTGLADRTAARLRAHGLVAGRVTVKIRRADFTTYTRQRVLEPPTQDTAAICAMAHLLLAEWLGRDPDAAVRLLGVGAADLQRPRQSDLFLAPQPKDSRLDAAVDGIRDRFGSTRIDPSQLPVAAARRRRTAARVRLVSSDGHVHSASSASAKSRSRLHRTRAISI